MRARGNDGIERMRLCSLYLWAHEVRPACFMELRCDWVLLMMWDDHCSREAQTTNKVFWCHGDSKDWLDGNRVRILSGHHSFRYNGFAILCHRCLLKSTARSAFTMGSFDKQMVAP